MGETEARGPLATKVLLVDDDRDACDLLRIILEEDGHLVAVADDGDRGIEIARAFRPHVAFIDLRMPRVDGFTVARTLRSEFGSEVWLVAVSAQAPDVEGDEAGFDFHYSKPVAVDELRMMIRAVRLGLAPA